MKPVQETLTISPTSGRSSAEARARRARSVPTAMAFSVAVVLGLEILGKKTSSIGTTLARVFTPAEA